jgi:cyanophycinase-like exopeptidase
MPHADELPRWLLRLTIGTHRKLPIAAIDGKTALISSEGEWFVVGRGAVTISHARHTTRYTAGQRVPLNPSPVVAKP